jgi:glycosyltransferase involved in cell wall biosynthesis
VTKSEVPEEPGVTVHRNLGPNSAELVALYHQADVFCLPTRGDCLPMVLSEAGAAGLPAVSTAVAGIPEIVRDGETGLVVPPDDRPALVRALRRLVDDPDLRLRLGKEAQAVVSRDFDAARNVDRLAEILRRVAAGDEVVG